MSPATPARFVTVDDVTERFEGNWPSDRNDWLELRIDDVENELISEVPALARINIGADAASTDPVEAAAGRRVGRVRTLIIEKVLELFRNPDGAVTIADSMDGIHSSRSYSGRLYAGSASSGIVFTDAELNRVRLRKPRRPNIGTYATAPWRLR